jgi:hypothetical protein
MQVEADPLFDHPNMKWIIEKYRNEAWESFNSEYRTSRTLRQSILECLFSPKFRLPEGKTALTHLHPDHDKLHLPHGIRISDWRKYRVEDHAALVKFQARCHAAGLHDPWLRNYAFQWYPNMCTKRARLPLVTIGMVHGFCMALVVYVGEKIYDQFYPTVYRHTPEYTAKYGTKEVFH